MKTDRDSPNPDLTGEIRALRGEIERLNAHRYIRVHNSLPKMMGYSLLRGLALGLGTVIGASVLVSILVYFLSQIDFIPIIGDWAAELADTITANVGGEPQPEANQDGSIDPEAPPDSE